MKIVFLNSETPFTKEQRKRVKKLGEVVFVEKAKILEDEVIEYIKQADILAPTPSSVGYLNKKMLEAGKHLKGIALITTGTFWVDMRAARKYKPPICNVPTYSTESVAEQLLGLLLSLTKNITLSDRKYREKNITDFTHYLGCELMGKTIGILGLGNIGSRVAEIARDGFKMKILGFNRSKKRIKGVKQVSLKELLRETDIIANCLPLTEETRDLLREKEFKLMKNGVFIVSTSPEPIINKKALLKYLKNGKIKGYGYDMDWEEKYKKNPFLKFNNVVVTPHIGWYTKESLDRNIKIWIDNIEAIVKGKPQNVVN